MAPLPQYMPAPYPSAAPGTPTPAQPWQMYGPYPTQVPQMTRTPYPTPYLPQQSQMPMANNFPSYGDWLASRGLASGAYSQSGQMAAQPRPDIFAPVKGALEKQATGWLEDQGKSYLDDIFFSGSGGSGAIPAGSGASDVLGGLASPTMPQIGPTIGNAQGLPALPGGGMFDISGIGGAGNAILPAAGAVGLYDLFKNKRRGGRGALQGAASGAAAGSYFGPWGAGIGAALGAGASLFNHKTTKEYEADKTKKLLSKSSDPGWQQAVQHFRSVEHPDGDTGKNFNAKEALERAKKDGKVLWGTSAVMDEFGPEWLSGLSENQREQITRQMAVENLFNNKKGDWGVTNSARAQQIANDVKSGKSFGGQQGGALQNLPGPLNKGPAKIDIQFNDPNIDTKNIAPYSISVPRSKTSSPGIGKDGRRITYGRK